MNTDKTLVVKFLKEVAIPEVKTLSSHGGLVPRFHTGIADKFFGGTKESLAKVCNELATEGVLHKSFIKFALDETDKKGLPDQNGKVKIESGKNVGMTIAKDGTISTPVYWFKDDKDIPAWAYEDKVANFRAGEDWFKMQQNPEADVPM
jgi:hypothetical protein